MMLSIKRIKHKCILTYCYVELMNAEQDRINNKDLGSIVEDDTKNQIREQLLIVVNRLKYHGFTFDKLKDFMIGKPKLVKHYNDISKIVDKIFKEGDSWVPAILVCSLLNESKLFMDKKSTLFNDIDFVNLIELYEKSGYDRKYITKHMKAATEVLLKLKIIE